MGLQWGLIGFSCCYLVSLEIRYLKIQWLIIIFPATTAINYVFFGVSGFFPWTKPKEELGFFPHRMMT